MLVFLVFSEDSPPLTRWLMSEHTLYSRHLVVIIRWLIALNASFETNIDLYVFNAQLIRSDCEDMQTIDGTYFLLSLTCLMLHIIYALFASYASIPAPIYENPVLTSLWASLTLLW